MGWLGMEFNITVGHSNAKCNISLPNTYSDVDNAADPWFDWKLLERAKANCQGMMENQVSHPITKYYSVLQSTTTYYLSTLIEAGAVLGVYFAGEIVEEVCAYLRHLDVTQTMDALSM